MRRSYYNHHHLLINKSTIQTMMPMMMMMLMFKNEEMRHLLSNQNISVCMATLFLTVGVAFHPSHPNHQVMTKFSIMKGKSFFEKLAFLRKFDQAHLLESLSSQAPCNLFLFRSSLPILRELTCFSAFFKLTFFSRPPCLALFLVSYLRASSDRITEKETSFS